MAIKLGDLAVSKAYLGTTELSQLYLGDDPLLSAGFTLGLADAFNVSELLDGRTPDFGSANWSEWQSKMSAAASDGGFVRLGATVNAGFAVFGRNASLPTPMRRMECRFASASPVAEDVPGWIFRYVDDDNLFLITCPSSGTWQLQSEIGGDRTTLDSISLPSGSIDVNFVITDDGTNILVTNDINSEELIASDSAHNTATEVALYFVTISTTASNSRSRWHDIKAYY